MNLTTTNITFLSDVPSSMEVNKSSGWRHHYFDGIIHYDISKFIHHIGPNKIYLIIPLLGSSKSLKNATLNLSQPFLINNKSNRDLVCKFIVEQWQNSGFDTKPNVDIFFSFKFKRVSIYY